MLLQEHKSFHCLQTMVEKFTNHGGNFFDPFVRWAYSTAYTFMVLPLHRQCALCNSFPVCTKLVLQPLLEVFGRQILNDNSYITFSNETKVASVSLFTHWMQSDLESTWIIGFGRWGFFHRISCILLLNIPRNIHFSTTVAHSFTQYYSQTFYCCSTRWIHKLFYHTIWKRSVCSFFNQQSQVQGWESSPPRYLFLVSLLVTTTEVWSTKTLQLVQITSLPCTANLWWLFRLAIFQNLHCSWNSRRHMDLASGFTLLRSKLWE